MNLKQLEVFVAVAESGSFSKGAEVSFITQSTVSQHIAALETEFGLRLLDRTGKGALLTEGGKLLLDRARRLLDAAREIPLALARFKGMEDAKLTVAGSSIPAEYMIPSALQLLIDKFPGVSITVLQGDSRDVQEKLLAEEAEFGIVGGHFPEDGLEFTPLASDEIVLIAAAGHRWAERGGIEAHELVGEPVILRETGSGTGKALVDALRSSGIEPEQLRVAARVGSNEAAKRAVMAGVGVTFVSAVSVSREVALGALIQVPVAGVSVARDFYLVERKGRELSPAAAAFSSVMREMYGCG